MTLIVYNKYQSNFRWMARRGDLPLVAITWAKSSQIRNSQMTKNEHQAFSLFTLHMQARMTDFLIKLSKIALL